MRDVLIFSSGVLIGISGLLLILKNEIRKKEAEIARLREKYDGEKTLRIKFETQLEELRRNVEEQKLLLDEAAKKFSDTFSALSKEALKSNNEMFLSLAKSSMEKIIVDMKGDFSKREEAISHIVKPLREALDKYDTQIRAMEENRQKAYGSLEAQLNNLMETHRMLQKETSSLVHALRTPHVRGRWGEVTLKRVVELAGMSRYCDFTEQITLENKDGSGKNIRPDMVVHLPNERVIVVDSKVPLNAYLDAVSSEDDEEYEKSMKKHADQVLSHIKNLSKKEYWSQFDKTPDFVVMFIPGEIFFTAALKYNKGILEEGVKNRVFLATPGTLIALLRTVAYGWHEEQITKNALKIRDLGSDVYDRLVTFSEHIAGVGKSLKNATESYNKMVGSLEGRLFPAAKKFKELGVTAKKNLKDIPQIENFPREISIGNEDVDS